MKVLLTGATGYIGSAVAEKLKDAGHEVLALARSDAAHERLAGRGYSPVRGDMTDADGVAALARDADAVVHAANTQDAANAAADAALTTAVLRALEGTGKPFVYTSGVWTVGGTGDGYADEAWTPNSIPLVAWRVPIEATVLAAAAQNVRSVVIRPVIVYGRGGGIPAMFVEEARSRGAVRVVDDGRQEWPFVHVDDLADLYVRALDAPAGTLLHGGSGTSYPLRDVAVAASVAGGADGKMASWTLDEARKEFGGFADALALHQRISGARARELLGWAPKRASLIEDIVTGSYRARA